jgi:type III restriction enzyme
VRTKLFAFQETAARQVLGHLNVARYGYDRTAAGGAVGLTATTGAGKTVIATAIIEAILFGSELMGIPAETDAVFLWLTDMPELNKQTMDKMALASPGLRSAQTEIQPTFNEPSLRAGRIYFLNTQKLAAGAGLTKTGPGVKRTFTFWDVMRKTVTDERRMLYLVVDEAHRGMTEGEKFNDANTIVQRFIKGYPEGPMPAAPIVLGISATLDRYTALVGTSGRSQFLHEVPVEEVRASGLIKDRTFADYAGERQRDEMALFPVAVRAWKKTGEDWTAYQAEHPDPEDPKVVPAFIIQVENEPADKSRPTQTPLDAVINAITDEVGALPEAAFVHAFGEKETVTVGQRMVRYVEPSKIADDAAARVVFFKSSLGTGWDCPRAEVLFSFRRAVDPTSIAQTIGRMVRSPLHRRIAETADLNNAYSYLPHYDKHGVDAIVDALNATGNQGAAAGLTTTRESVTLARRTDLDRLTEAIEALPSWIVGTPRARAEIRVLMELTTFLSSSGLDAAAYETERKALTALLVKHCAALSKKAAFKREVDDQGEIVFHRAELVPGLIAVTQPGRKEPASEETIARTFAVAKTRLTGDVAKAYVAERNANKISLRTARLEAYALAARDDVITKLNQHAAGRIQHLRQTFGTQVLTRSASQQNRYNQIIQLAPTPTQTTVKLPNTAAFAKGDAAVPANHLYADAYGASPIKLNATLELPTIAEDAGRPHVIGWLRCVDRQDWALCVKCREPRRPPPLPRLSRGPPGRQPRRRRHHRPP